MVSEVMSAFFAWMQVEEIMVCESPCPLGGKLFMLFELLSLHLSLESDLPWFLDLSSSNPSLSLWELRCLRVSFILSFLSNWASPLTSETIANASKGKNLRKNTRRGKTNIGCGWLPHIRICCHSTRKKLSRFSERREDEKSMGSSAEDGEAGVQLDESV